MTATTLNGGTQIRAGTITLDRLASGYSIPTANLVDGANFLKKDGSVTMTGNLNMGSNKVTGVSVPTAATDAVTKSYVDGLVSGFTIHGAKVVAVANVAALTGLPTTDGATLVDGDVQLLTAQSTGSQNGPWVVHAGAWTRPTWWAAAAVIPEGNYFLIDPDGTTYKNTKWFITTVGNVTVDTTSVAFTQDLSGTSYTNGTGLGLAGNVFSVLYGTTSTTATVGNDSRVTGALQTSALGANVQTGLGVAVGSAGAVVLNGGVLGTPSSGTLTNASGLPIGGITGLGTGVATALAAASNAGSGLAVLSSGVLAAAQHPALTGDVTNSAGSLATTINHAAGSGFVKYTDWIWDEVPTGAVNGANATFTLANSPANTSTAMLAFLNGDKIFPGAGNDYTVSGAVMTLLTGAIPQTGDRITVSYLK